MAVDADAVFAEWSLADDGVYERSSARVVIVDGDERVLLMRTGHGEDVRWFTIGGGIADGEEPLAAGRTARHHRNPVSTRPGGAGRHRAPARMGRQHPRDRLGRLT